MTWVTNWLISPSNKKENIKESRFYEKKHEEYHVIKTKGALPWWLSLVGLHRTVQL